MTKVDFYFYGSKTNSQQNPTKIILFWPNQNGCKESFDFFFYSKPTKKSYDFNGPQ